MLIGWLFLWEIEFSVRGFFDISDIGGCFLRRIPAVEITMRLFLWQ